MVDKMFPVTPEIRPDRKLTIVNPMMAELVREVRAIRLIQESSAKVKPKDNTGWLYIFGGICAIGTIFMGLGVMALIVDLLIKAHSGS
jgi:hypothetical protein